MTLAASSPSLNADKVRDVVDRTLEDFLTAQEQASSLPELSLFTGVLREHLAAGGKHIRPLLCVTGWYATTEQPPLPAVYRAAASLELFHTFALIHDDIMDNSASRRGHPTAQRALAALHTDRYDAESLGINAAILLGDLALGWSYDLLRITDAGADPLIRAWPLLNTMRVETLVGQYLDLVTTRPPVTDPDLPWRAIRYKTAKYTVERPLQIGAVLAGARPGQLRALSAYALPLGEAFQLRDDLLGVFGTPEQTGKSVLDDLREGKHTVLVATALARATAEQEQVLRTHLGVRGLTPADAAAVRQVLKDTGARAAVEQMIAERHRRALDALDQAPLRPSAREVLRQQALSLTERAL
ncbi:All-trans-nonaprenyl-diphosphate synthase (geranyl-diphosphate specific) [Streptomyces sp. YIM 121038]|uniref:polyprenyl synthetase family protein n=1 Tax=Streptomyces sp. YIM 121038 TaxID=2136401 RepID=UPI00111076FD|nr:polyprenyl synthetase family protein [Streptomyces sp. YIM 121038]QCX74630.1 All-trans-nonaprenyl-diphosphate synthase (geranyl-diphosphate specific) [Streptomyces sp. YIM 121038]